ncbi:MAG: PQQ-like beta-propeller repeat protein [Planctomycetaceae bacterium]|jgi:outer membrane protein assembly factor BamB|nr:PQQ-like beta-propeller repeat protein [Planctomycetaceae bacterium]MBT6157992.1 PQQ-like beta-propeller repeat protein [Planctomycetaceae bacterium]MBT6487371.1 PQQ-like beta-propeller repeat protein [Planctomycetaceae bacterium]MBT6496876.1 PQQ-like beta-propeller repeat protein [Planctomycetaceae bacterium]
MSHLRFRGLCVVTLSIVLAQSANAENWPGWRGPRGDGSIAEANGPVKWGVGENVAWKVEMPYGGHSSPVVWNDYVFVVGADTEKQNRMLVALDRKSGKTLWEQAVVHAPLEKKHKLNSFASGTPATDGKLVYVSFLEVDTQPAPAVKGKRRRATPGKMVVAAYDLAGNLKWRVKPGVFSSVHGFCSSPVIYKDSIIVNGDHDGEAYIVALDRDNGKTLWKTSRENKTRSYCTPIIREINGRMQMMLSGSKCVTSYNPDNGSLQWIIDGPTEQFVASLVYNKGLLFLTGGFPDKHILAIDPTGSGNVTESHIRWRHHRKGVSYVPSPVAAGKYFYLVSDNGIGSCYDSETGKVMWQERMGRHYSGSLVATKKHVFYQDDDGITKVVKVGPKFEVVAENNLDEPVYSSLSASQGQYFIRAENHLFCIGAKTTVSQR